MTGIIKIAQFCIMLLENGHLSVVEYLVNQKADINAKNELVEFLYLI